MLYQTPPLDNFDSLDLVYRKCPICDRGNIFKESRDAYLYEHKLVYISTLSELRNGVYLISNKCPICTNQIRYVIA